MGLLVLCLIFLTLSILTLNWFYSKKDYPDPDHLFFTGGGGVQIIAHRGGALERPENTHMAFSYVANNFPGAIIELDVQITADDHLIVMHDESLDRTTNGTGKVSNASLRQISRLNAGYNFEFNGKYPYRETTYSQLLVPKLEDVFKRYGNRMIIEIKGNAKEQNRAVSVLVEMITSLMQKSGGISSRYNRNYGKNLKNLTSRLVISSEFFIPIYSVRRSRPDWLFASTKPEIIYNLIPLSKFRVASASAAIDDILKLRSDIHCLPKSYRGKEIISKQLIKELKRRKQPLYAWTINDEKEMEELIKMGVDGIITDRPRVLKNAILRMAN